MIDDEFLNAISDSNPTDFIFKIYKLGESNIIRDYKCSICLDSKTELISTLYCNHSFHKKCIMKWLETSNVCPICRRHKTEK